MDKIASELVKIAKDLVGGSERDYLFLGRLQTDLDYALNERQPSYGSEKHLMMLNFEDQIKEMKKLWNRVDEKPEWLTKRDIADYEKRIKKFRRSKVAKEFVSVSNAELKRRKDVPYDIRSIVSDVLSKFGTPRDSAEIEYDYDMVSGSFNYSDRGKEINKFRKMLNSKLSPYKKYINDIDYHDGTGDWYIVYVRLKYGA